MISYQQLQKELNLENELPVTPDWSAAADFLSLIKDYCLESQPQSIVECSSGLTTLALARCCQINGDGRVFSLENGEEYANQTRANLMRFEVDKFVNVIHAPLEKTLVQGEYYDWYGLNEVEDINIDMLVIDGPPGFIQKHSRFPAIPLLFDQLADKSMVFLDDAARDEEKELVKMWLALYPEIKHEFVETERGCSILTVNKS